jgi:hypothetical protein
MPSPQKQRAAKAEPPLTRLKRLSAEDRAQVWAWKDEPNMTNAAIRARIEASYGIELRRDGQLSEFWAWQFRQMQWDRLGDISDQDEEMLRQKYPHVDRDRLRDATIKRMYALADLEQDPKFGLKVVLTDLKESSERRDWEKFELERQSKLDAGLDELAELVKPYADLVAEFQLWRGRLNERLAK